MSVSEEQNERRLAREAQERLGTLTHDDCKGVVAATSAIVEVYNPVRDVAGHFLVIVPSVDTEGLSEDEALAQHPATLATDVVNERVPGWDVVDVRSH